MPTGTRPRTLTDLPNISFVLAEALHHAGIQTPQRLCELGAEHAWRLLATTGVRSCIQSLLALEGAVSGVDWHALPSERRHELVRFAAQQLN